MEIEFKRWMNVPISVEIVGTEDAIKEFKEKFLVKDINGEYLQEGDMIQGYNNKIYAVDKSRLYETGVMEVKYPDIYYKVLVDKVFQRHPEIGRPWFWKVG